MIEREKKMHCVVVGLEWCGVCLLFVFFFLFFPFFFLCVGCDDSMYV